MIIFPGAVNGKVFIPAKDGIFDQHRASSNEHLYALSKKFDERTQTRRFEAMSSLVPELNFPLTFQLNVITMYLHFIFWGTIS